MTPGINSDQFGAIYRSILELKILARVFLNMAQGGYCTYTCDTPSANTLLGIADAAEAALHDVPHSVPWQVVPADKQQGQREVSA